MERSRIYITQRKGFSRDMGVLDIFVLHQHHLPYPGQKDPKTPLPTQVPSPMGWMQEWYRLAGRGIFWLLDYYRSLSCSPLAGFVVDATQESTNGWGGAKPVQSGYIKQKKVTVKSEGSHRNLFSLIPAKWNQHPFSLNGKLANAELRGMPLLALPILKADVQKI